MTVEQYLEQLDREERYQELLDSGLTPEEIVEREEFLKEKEAEHRAELKRERRRGY